MIGLSYKQKCNNFGYLSIQVWLKGNDTAVSKKNLGWYWVVLEALFHSKYTCTIEELAWLPSQKYSEWSLKQKILKENKIEKRKKDIK